jgi:hypothetical protein
MKSLLKFLVSSILFVSLAGSAFSQSDEILFRRYLISSGYNAAYYGVAFDLIFELDGPGAAGLPLIAGGAGVVIPLLSNSTKTVTSNTLLLTSHGQTLGWAHGAALGAVINGYDAFGSDNRGKLTIFLAAATSIGMGITGHKLSKTKDWSEGRVAIYRHYGWVMPGTGVCAALAFSDDARVVGAADLVFGATGYLLADRVNSWHEFTRGEVRATQTLAVLNAALGFCIFAESEPYSGSASNEPMWLLPAVGALAGTGLGHLWTKDANFSIQQGMTTIYASAGGAIIGLGLALMIDSKEFTTYYAIPYVTSMAAYAITVESLKKKNRNVPALSDLNQKGNWNFAFMPQNVFVNNKIGQKGYMINGRYAGMQPLFAASCTF